MTLATTKKIALSFFIIGTCLFTILLVTNSEFTFVFLSVVFILVALIFTFIMLLILIVQLLKHNELDTYFSIVIILSNIPIALSYAYILIHFL